MAVSGPSFGGTCEAVSIGWTAVVETVQPSPQREFGEVALMRLALALMLMVASAGAASAEVPADWPDRPLRMIVPLPAGSAGGGVALPVRPRLWAQTRA